MTPVGGILVLKPRYIVLALVLWNAGVLICATLPPVGRFAEIQVRFLAVSGFLLLVAGVLFSVVLSPRMRRRIIDREKQGHYRASTFIGGAIVASVLAVAFLAAVLL
jgi:hypothetical protein